MMVQRSKSTVSDTAPKHFKKQSFFNLLLRDILIIHIEIEAIGTIEDIRVTMTKTRQSFKNSSHRDALKCQLVEMTQLRRFFNLLLRDQFVILKKNRI